MTLNESIIEDAALTWFGKLSYAIGHGPHIATGEPAAERDSFGEVVLVDRLSEAIQRLTLPSNLSPLPHLRNPLLAKLLSGEVMSAQ